MVVRTDTDRLNQVRRITCEMLIADHPSDCLSCSSNQNCELQKVAYHLGISEQRLDKTAREPVIDDSNLEKDYLTRAKDFAADGYIYSPYDTKLFDDLIAKSLKK